MKKSKLYNITIIEKYISKQILFGLLIVSSILLGIAWFSQIIRLLSYLVNNNLSMWTFLKMTSLLLPDLVSIILPIALFAVVLFVYNKLISDKELIIMEAIRKEKFPDVISKKNINLKNAIYICKKTM